MSETDGHSFIEMVSTQIYLNEKHIKVIFNSFKYSLIF